MKVWPFHRHRYFEVDRQWLERGWWDREGKVVGPHTPITKITERCAERLCGKYRQQTLVGHLPGGHTRGDLATSDSELEYNR